VGAKKIGRKEFGATVEVAKRNELHKFEVMPKRWVVERSFAWFEKWRRLWENCERKLNSSLQMVHLAFPPSSSEDREQVLSEPYIHPTKDSCQRRLSGVSFLQKPP
jgi:hypothetical protein